jgi:hypothetical protein
LLDVLNFKFARLHQVLVEHNLLVMCYPSHQIIKQVSKLQQDPSRIAGPFCLVVMGFDLFIVPSSASKHYSCLGCLASNYYLNFNQIIEKILDFANCLQLPCYCFKTSVGLTAATIHVKLGFARHHY